MTDTFYKEPDPYEEDETYDKYTQIVERAISSTESNQMKWNLSCSEHMDLSKYLQEGQIVTQFYSYSEGSDIKLFLVEQKIPRYNCDFDSYIKEFEYSLIVFSGETYLTRINKLSIRNRYRLHELFGLVEKRILENMQFDF